MIKYGCVRWFIFMESVTNKTGKYLLLFLAIFIAFRELIALYAGSFIKFLPDVLVWGELLLVLIKNLN